jgi:hypothetical protein
MRTVKVRILPPQPIFPPKMMVLRAAAVLIPIAPPYKSMLRQATHVLSPLSGFVLSCTMSGHSVSRQTSFSRSRSIAPTVFRRPSCPRGRLLALPESHRRCSARRSGPPDPGRETKRRCGSNLGTLLLLPETVFQRQGSSTLETRRLDALRP